VVPRTGTAYVGLVSAVWFRVAVWIRRRAGALIRTALIIGVVAGVALAMSAGARRTASAPDRYTRAAGGDPDFQITQQAGLPLTREVADLPEVTSAEGYSFVLSFPLAPTDGTPLLDLNPFAGDDDAGGARVVEGRFTDPDQPYEFTVNRPLARTLERRFGTEVGDRFEFASYSIDQVRGNVDISTEAPALAPFTATLVGITESPAEFDDQSGGQLVLSSAFLKAHPDIGIVQSLISTKVDGTDSRGVLDEVHEMADGADAHAVPLRIVSDSARRAVGYQSLALWLVSGLALVGAAVVAALIAARALRVGSGEHAELRSLGWRRRDLMTERAVEGALIGVAALPVAALIGYLGTTPFPLGILEMFEPDPGARLDLVVLGLGLPALVAVVAAAGAVAGGKHLRPSRAAAAAAPPRVPAGAGMPFVVGLHYAASNAAGRRPWRAIAIGALGIAGIVGAAFAGSALTTVVDTPERWGVNFDSMFGNPYAPTQDDLVTPLIDLDDVSAATGAHIGSVTIDGSDTQTIAFARAKGDLVPTVLEGRVPRTDDEIGVGAEVARRVGVDVGDHVEVAGVTGDPERMLVVGIVVLPGTAGNGATMTFDSYRRTNPVATQNVVLVRFRPGTPASAVEAVSAAVYSPPDSLATPLSIRALERVTAAPFLLCGVIAFMLLVSGAYLLATSVRVRSTDLATLRALGAEGRQVRAVVRWQAMLITGAMVVVGVPLGVIAGRLVIRSITTTLGIVPTIDVPLWLVVAGVVVPLVVAGVLTIIPARRAARASVAHLSQDR